MRRRSLLAALLVALASAAAQAAENGSLCAEAAKLYADRAQVIEHYKGAPYMVKPSLADILHAYLFAAFLAYDARHGLDEIGVGIRTVSAHDDVDVETKVYDLPDGLRCTATGTLERSGSWVRPRITGSCASPDGSGAFELEIFSPKCP